MNLSNQSSPVSQLTDQEWLLVRARAQLEIRHRETHTYREYVNMVRPGFIWYKHCEVMAEVLEAVAAGQIQNAMFFVPPRHALAVDTPIPTPDGFKSIGELKLGDHVYGPDGRPIFVTGVSDIFTNVDVWKVEADDGASVYADAEHVWHTRLCRGYKVFKDHTTHWLAARTCDRRPMLPAYQAVEKSEKELLIHPYVLGVWLGDGTCRSAVITSPDYDQSFIRRKIESFGVPTSDQKTRMTFGILGILVRLRSLGLLGNKHIPAEYYNGSISQRWDLIHGLMDADGNVSKEGQCIFNTTTENLKDGFLEIIRSLGVKASVSRCKSFLNGKRYKDCFKISFYSSNGCTLPRKRERCREYIKPTGRYISFTPAGKMDTRCITVDSEDGLYLWGRGFLVTHNSKSEMIIRSFTGYYIRKYPERWVGLSSYSAGLARGLSRDARDRYAASGGIVRQDVRGVMEWMTPEGGGLWSCGVGGPATGKGGHLLTIDDPYKNQEEARSIAVRRARQDWYEGVWLFRREPNASMILVMTRWNELDLAAFILEKEKEFVDAVGWHLVILEAEKLSTSYSIPKTCTLQADWRKPGEPLCPERFDLNALRKIKANAGRFWHAEWQQRPTVEEGDVWKSDWFKVIATDKIYWPHTKEELEGKTEAELEAIDAEDAKKIKLQDIGYDWDTAYTKEDDNSASAFIKAGKAGGNVYIIDAGARFVEFPALVKWMDVEGGTNYIEKKATGKSAVQVLRAAGIYAREVRVSGIEKVERAKLASVAAETGHVYVLSTVHQYLLYDDRQGVTKFPNGTHDDLNDALVQAINRLWKRPTLRLTVLGELNEQENMR